MERTNAPARMKRLAAVLLCMVALAAQADEQDSDGAVVITGGRGPGAETTANSGVVVIGGDGPGHDGADPIAPGQRADARTGVSEPGPTEAADKVTKPAPSDQATLVQPDTFLEWEPAAGA